MERREHFNAIKGYEADFAVVVDTSNLHMQGQGGVITGWITVKSPQTFHDATRRQMIHAGGVYSERARLKNDENCAKFTRIRASLGSHENI